MSGILSITFAAIILVVISTILIGKFLILLSLLIIMAGVVIETIVALIE